MPCSPVYEFHDISVENFANIAKVLDNFNSEIKWNLMIIPFCSGAEQSILASFREQLVFWKNKGYSLHLHGYKHKACAKLKRSLSGKIALKLTNGEAEFAGLGKADLGELLGEALSAWGELRAGEPSGFVPPAWYASKALLSQCRQLGFENYGGRFITWNKNKGKSLSIPFSTAGIPKILIPFINITKKIYLKLYSVFNFLPTPRIVKHPEDLCLL
ncbi:MAG: DUF2334 domain-containing protein [Fibromonadaceae bacterium]|jgi:hypothetical protein|nr:DUF2334 domain-containing protein [Fibromonadaceae bacterium]